MNDGLKFRKASVGDAKAIQSLINYFASQKLMLPRPISHLYENIRDFTVVESGNEIIGCSALHPCWESLGELRSVAVKDQFRGKGVGKGLIEKSLFEASGLGIERIFSLTYIPDFFIKMGFRRVEHSELPQKIWQDCISCVNFPDCKEVAVILELKAKG